MSLVKMLTQTRWNGKPVVRGDEIETDAKTVKRWMSKNPPLCALINVEPVTSSENQEPVKTDLQQKQQAKERKLQQKQQAKEDAGN